jgi:hypothetical protein
MAMRTTTFTIFPKVAIQAGFFQLTNLMQDHKEILKPCLSQFTFHIFTPP